MVVITPTITTDDEHTYREQMMQISEFSDGVHIDFADGELAPTKLLPLSKGWREDSLITHIHVMYKNPKKYIKEIMKISPDLVILHSESEELTDNLNKLREEGFRTGIAILPDTPMLALTKYEGLFDHVLVFAGKLGYQGGEADLSQLKKVSEIHERFPGIEIAWDGGVTDKNVKEIAFSGVSVINVGSFISKSKDPKKAYELLTSLIS